MTDYTPTTEEVLDAYALFKDEDFEDSSEEFDRWLAEVKAQAVKEYQEKHWAEFNKSLALDPYRQGETE